VPLRNFTQPARTGRAASAAMQDSFACACMAAAGLRQGWLKVIGAPDYRAYLAHLARRHPGATPMSEREYARMFIEHRYGGGGGLRCC